jgi:hypothetical protein
MKKLPTDDINSPQNFNKYDKELDDLFDLLGDKLLVHEFQFVDDYIKNQNIVDTPIVILCGVLTITYRWKHKLPSRTKFFIDVETHVRNVLLEDCKDIMIGLDDYYAPFHEE